MRRNERYSIQSKKNRVTRKKLYIYMIKSLSEVFSVATQYLVPVSKMATAAEVGFTRETKSNGGTADRQRVK